jgi:oligosaccharide repeat unit polymerase
MFFILYNILKIKIKIKTLVIIGIGIILMFLILYSFVYNDIYINTSQRYIVNKMNIPLELSFLIDPYIYIMCNFENLNNYIVNGPNTFFMGAASFKFIFSIMNIDSGVSETWKNNLQYPWLNTGSMFKDFYMDFGIIGIIIFTFLIGFIATYVYRKAISQKNILYCFLYTSITYALCMSFFTNYFAATDFVFNVIICYIVSKFIENSKA